MKKGLLLYTEEDYLKNREFAELLIRHAKSCQIAIEIVLEKELKYGIKDGKMFFCMDGIEKHISFVINRTRNGFISEILESLKIRVFNSAEVTKFCNDKIQAYLKIQSVGIPCLDTYIYTKDSIGLSAKADIEFPAVVKKPFGHGGNNVYLCENGIDLAFALKNIDGRFLLVQKKLNVEKISDVRVFVVGGKIIGAIRRTAKKGLLANYCKGGDISVYPMDSILSGLVDKISKLCAFDYAGFDFLIGNDGYYFNEIEDVVGSRSLYALTEIDSAYEFIRHINKNI